MGCNCGNRGKPLSKAAADKLVAQASKARAQAIARAKAQLAQQQK